ncbi:MAG TPA: carboxypeptidase-like regulatory domain-containing protein [Gemmatimonadaceae bacterium]
MAWLLRRIVTVGAAAAVASTVAQGAAAQASPDSTATLVGFVTIKEAAVPLPYSVVSITQPSREQFTDERGVFRIGNLPRGVIRLRVRHVGYVPVDLNLTLTAGATDTVRVALTRIAVRLTTMQVRAYPECLAPGPPAATDTAFTTIFDQLKQNAEQFRLLMHTYPFVYAVERISSTVLGGIDLRRDRIDTLTLTSDNQWRYSPGTVVVEEKRTPGIAASATMNIPTLANFADPLFVANHCFFNGGLETIDKEELLRVDFVVASALAEPDVDGSIFLDPTTFQIRRSFLHLSKTLKAVAEVTGTEVTTIFAELFPSVPVISTVNSVNHLRVNTRRYKPPTQTREQQQLIAVAFTGRKPGEDAKRP